MQLCISNRKILLQLKTRELNNMSEIIMNRMQLISNLSLKNWNTSQGLMQLLIEVQEYVIKAISHNIK